MKKLTIERKLEANKKLFSVTTSKPWDIETIEGLQEFDLLEEQIN